MTNPTQQHDGRQSTQNAAGSWQVVAEEIAGGGV